MTSRATAGQGQGDGSSVPFTYQLKRGKRRSIAVIVDHTGGVVVRAPRYTSQAQIAAFVEEKSVWIIRTQAKAVEARRLTEAYLSELVGAGETKDEMLARVRRSARQTITAAVALRAAELGIHYKAVGINNAHARWGSCSAENRLNFTWRLALCPPEVIDYVVVHELCHVAHKNHGSSFWAAVAATDPGYKKQRAWLRDHRALLSA